MNPPPRHLNLQVLEIKMAGVNTIFSPPRFPDSSRYQMHFLPILVHVILVFTPESEANDPGGGGRLRFTLHARLLVGGKCKKNLASEMTFIIN